MDPFVILPQERSRYVEQFNSLKPVGGYVSGDQAKGFLLQSQLPPVILGHIWELADMNADGKLDFTEFSIACKLINAKLRGFDIPKLLPPNLKSSASAGVAGSLIGTPPGTATGTSFVPGGVGSVGGPSLIGMSPLTSSAVPLSGVTLPANAPLVQPIIQSSMQPSVQPIIQPLAQPVVNPIMPPMVQPIVRPMTQPAVPSNLPLSMQTTGSAINLPAIPAPVPTGMISPPSAAVVPMAGSVFQASPSFDGSKPNTPDSVKTVLRASSVASRESSTEWIVPHSSKLKYAQLFNSHDRGKTGFLTGVQARGVLVQTQLPQALLARIWGLSDIDMDGRLSSDEFVLAMHLCDLVRAGEKLPDVLSQELIPPSFRRPSFPATSSNSLVSPKGSSTPESVTRGAVVTSPTISDELKVTSPVSFEDKRKENFDKGQAELDKRRKALAEQQRREQEERERKEREEIERKEKLRLEQERRQQAEMEKKLAKQREIEMEKEEQRRKMLEQREAARKEMERQRQLEWQKQRLQELIQQRQKEQEKVALLRANHQRLETELSVLDDRVIDLSSKIIETRTGVAETKNTIDGMRSTRDAQMTQLSGLKTQLREQNQRLLSVSQEKVRLEAKNRMNASVTPVSNDQDAVQNTAARQIALQQTKEKLDQLTEELKKKLADAENNNAELTSLKTEVSTLARTCKQSYQTYQKKREEALLLRATGGKQNSWSSDTWSDSTNNWPVSSGNSTAGVENKSNLTRYRALYEFVARNGDEVSFQPGDIIMVTESLSNEPGWLSGEVRGHVGWFPEAYVEKMDQTGWADGGSGTVGTSGVDSPMTAAKRHPLEGIQELPENVSDNGSIADTGASGSVALDPSHSAFIPVAPKVLEDSSSPILGQGEIVDNLKAEAMYPWQGKKDNHLSFNKGDVILVREQQDHWWFGQCNNRSGWFPKSYVSLFQTDTVARSPTVAASPYSKGLDDNYYVAMYPYESNEPGDLTFEAGEMVLITKKDGDWWTGTIGNRSGVFPSNYVQRAELQYEAAADSEVEAATAAAETAAIAKATAPASKAPTQSDSKRPNTAPVDGDFETQSAIPRAASAASSGTASPSNMGRGAKKPEIATVIAPYTATSSEQLSLTRGQLIMIRKKSASGWWEGELQAKGRKRQLGWFPASYVKVLSSSGGSSRTTPVPAEMEDEMPKLPPAAPTETEINAAFELNNGSATDQVVALFPYTAQNEDELSFLQGDVLTIIDREDPAWWRGQLKGQVGLFPSNYVEVMGSLAASAALGAAASSASASSNPQWSTLAPSDRDAFSKLSPDEQKRQTVIQELINTEETYMDDMLIVTEVFQKPMLESGVIKKEDVDSIFVNWKDIISCNNTFLRALRIRKKMSPNGVVQAIGDILIDCLPHMSPYIRFCSQQLNAAALIQRRHENVPEFRSLLKTCQSHPKVKGMPLTSFLLKPMQRITKYPLLIKKILESTEETHPDRLLLDEALVRAEELCNQVNEGVREQENSDRLEWLQRRVQIEGLDERLVFNSVTNMLGPRKLIHFGPLKKVKSNKELLAFVFNDFLLFTTVNKPLASINLQFLFDKKSNLALRMYRKPIFLREMTVIPGESQPSEGSENESVPVRFTVQDPGRKYLLTSTSSADRILWLRKLEEARKHCLLTERAVLQRQRSKQVEGNVCGRLLVLVEGAENLQSSLTTVRQRPPVGKLRVIIAEGITLAARNCKGKSDTFCEVYLGSQEHRTKVVPNSLNPKWNASMQFLVKDLKQDVLCVTVLDRDYFSPNEFLGRTEVRIADVLQDSKIYRGPLIKRLPLHEVESGEIVLKLDLQLFHNRN